jgi:uncharacterized protein YndB with AHSA1/START domain
MIDQRNQLAAIERTVVRRPIAGDEGIGVVLRRRYDAPVAEVWAALTEPERVRRWFLPLSGDLRVGGTFQTEGNAGGEILRCEPPHLLHFTWGGPTSVVELRLDPAGDAATALEFAHTVPLSLAGSGAGALFVGPGWDGALMSLGRFLAGEDSGDPTAADTPEARAFTRGSVDAWVAAIERSGTATADELAGAANAALAQWVPDSQEGGPES